MNTRKDLIVWQKAMELVLEVYKVTKAYPREELFGLASRMCRAVVSIPSNIAEGYDRIHTRETERFLSMALGFACELETQLILSRDLEYISTELVQQLCDKTQGIIRMLTSLIKTLNKQLVYFTTCLLVN